MNIFEIIFNLFDLLIKYAEILYNFLFTAQTIGFDGINIFGTTILAFNYTFVPFFAIGGTTVVILLTAWLIKQFIPVA